MKIYKLVCIFSVFEKVGKKDNQGGKKYEVIENTLNQMINKMMPLFGIMFSVLYFAIGVYKTEFPNLEKLKTCKN